MPSIKELQETLSNAYYCPTCEEWFDGQDEEKVELHAPHFKQLAQTYDKFIRRLETALGYEPGGDDLDWKDLAVLCNHAAVRIERLTDELKTLKSGDRDIGEDDGKV